MEEEMITNDRGERRERKRKNGGKVRSWLLWEWQLRSFERVSALASRDGSAFSFFFSLLSVHSHLIISSFINSIWFDV